MPGLVTEMSAFSYELSGVKSEESGIFRVSTPLTRHLSLCPRLLTRRRYSGLEHPPGLEQLQRAVELRVFAEFALFQRVVLLGGFPFTIRPLPGAVFFDRWSGLRLPFLAKVAAEVFLTDLALLARGDLGWSEVLKRNVRRDAGHLDRAAIGGEVQSRGQAQRRTVLQRQNGLYRPLAKGLRAQDDGPAVVL